LPEGAEATIGSLGARGKTLSVARVLDPSEVSFPFTGPLHLRALEGEARAIGELDLDERRLHAVLLREGADRAVQPLDERLVRAFGDRRPDPAQKSFASEAGGAPMCARPSFVIVRPRGVRWM